MKESWRKQMIGFLFFEPGSVRKIRLGPLRGMVFRVGPVTGSRRGIPGQSGLTSEPFNDSFALAWSPSTWGQTGVSIRFCFPGSWDRRVVSSPLSPILVLLLNSSGTSVRTVVKTRPCTSGPPGIRMVRHGLCPVSVPVRGDWPFPLEWGAGGELPSSRDS